MIIKCNSALLFHISPTFEDRKKYFFQKSKKIFFTFCIAEADSTFSTKKSTDTETVTIIYVKNPKTRCLWSQKNYTLKLH